MRIIQVLLVLSLIFSLDHFPRGVKSSSERRQQTADGRSVQEYGNQPQADGRLAHLNHTLTNVDQLNATERIVVHNNTGASGETGFSPSGDWQRPDGRNILTFPSRQRAYEYYGFLDYPPEAVDNLFAIGRIALMNEPEEEAAHVIFYGNGQSSGRNHNPINVNYELSRMRLHDVRTMPQQEVPEHAQNNELGTAGRQHRNPDARHHITNGRVHEESAVNGQQRSLRIRRGTDAPNGTPSTPRLPNGRGLRYPNPRLHPRVRRE